AASYRFVSLREPWSRSAWAASAARNKLAPPARAAQSVPEMPVLMLAENSSERPAQNEGLRPVVEAPAVTSAQLARTPDRPPGPGSPSNRDFRFARWDAYSAAKCA